MYMVEIWLEMFVKRPSVSRKFWSSLLFKLKAYLYTDSHLHIAPKIEQFSPQESKTPFQIKYMNPRILVFRSFLGPIKDKKDVFLD